MDLQKDQELSTHHMGDGGWGTTIVYNDTGYVQYVCTVHYCDVLVIYVYI